jgi:hypothetical protein
MMYRGGHFVKKLLNRQLHGLYIAAITPFYHARDQSWNFKESMGARNHGGIGLSYRLARLHRLAAFIPWNRFMGSINV